MRSNIFSKESGGWSEPSSLPTIPGHMALCSFILFLDSILFSVFEGGDVHGARELAGEVALVIESAFG